MQDGQDGQKGQEGPHDFVLRALWALRPCDPRRCVHDACIYDACVQYMMHACIYDAANFVTNGHGDSRSWIKMTVILISMTE